MSLKTPINKEMSMKRSNPKRENPLLSDASVWVLAMALLCLVTPAAMAQGVQSLDGIIAAAPGTDQTVSMLATLLGSFVTNPFGLGTPTTLFGHLFFLFNSCIFIIGVIWGSYGLIVGVVQTAHEGEVLGKRLSAVWMPIRMVTGFAGLMPIFGGFSLAQAVMMLATLLGIGVANLSWNMVIDRMSEFETMIKPEITGATTGVSPQGLAYGLFASHVCMRLSAKDMAAERPYQASVDRGNSKHLTLVAPGSGGPDHCGSAKLTFLGEFRGTAQVNLGFTTSSVDYRGVESTLRTNAQAAFDRLRDYTEVAAIAWVDRWHGQRMDQSAGNNSVAVPFASLDQAAQRFLSDLVNGTNGTIKPNGTTEVNGTGPVSSNVSQLLQAGASNSMKQYGWMGAGAWYATLAEAQSTLLQAYKSLEVSVVDPSVMLISGERQYSTTVDDGLRAYLSQAGRHLKVDSSNDFADTFDKAWGVSTPTGNLSLGQAIVTKMIKGVTFGSGGDHGTDVGAGGTTGATLINPIVAMKNVGDYVMSTASGIMTGMAVAQFFPVKWAAKLATKLPGGLKDLGSNPDKADRSDSPTGLTSLSGLLGTMLYVLIGFGLFMSIYVPFIPFIHWMGGMIQYLTIFFEGLIAAPVWAFAHLESEGEGMGQRSERGYLFLFNMLFRPVMMLFGFMIAGGMIVLLGTAQAVLFVPAMANVQGNSITGLLSIIGLLGVFVILNVVLIHGLFSMITLIPDQVISWAGNVSGVNLGRDTDDRANQLFLHVGRGSTDVVGRGSNLGAQHQREQRDRLSRRMPKTP